MRDISIINRNHIQFLEQVFIIVRDNGKFKAQVRTIVWGNMRLGVHVRPCRGVLHTPLDRPRRGRIIIWGFMGYTFIPCGMVVGRMQYAPTQVHVFDRWMVEMFLGKGALHTPSYHTQQKQTIIWGFMVYSFIPCGMIVGRMLLRPTWVRAFDRWVVGMFSGRGVLHTPPDHTQQKRIII